MHKVALFITSLAVALFWCAAAEAETTFSGTITGNVTWTKASGPYVTSGVSIPSGATLTIEPGTIVKVTEESNPFTVSGTLVIGDLNSAEQTVITSLKDDAVGGDTNGDGATSTPAAGDWQSIVFNSGSSGNIANTLIAYGGRSSRNFSTGGYFTPPLIQNDGGTISIASTTLAHGTTNGFEQTAGSATISDSVFTELGKFGISVGHSTLSLTHSNFDTMRQGLLAVNGTALTLAQNSFAHLSSTDAVQVDGSQITFVDQGGNHGSGAILLGLTLSGDLTLPSDGLPYVPRYIEVTSNGALTILPGAVIKMRPDSVFTVSGTLTMGESASTTRAFVTSFKDDSLLGDTNGDGTSTPTAPDWGSIVFESGSTANIFHTSFSYGGASLYNPNTGGTDWLPTIRNKGGTLTIASTTLKQNGNYGILQMSGTTTITNSEIAGAGRSGFFLSAGAGSITHSSIHDNAGYGVSNYTANTLNATENWWGDASGPQHAQLNPSGLGNAVTDRVDFSGWLDKEPATTTPVVAPSCTENCNSNVLFLPGIEASRLYRPDYSGGTDQLWEPTGENDVSDLFLDASGKSVRNDIYTKDVVDEVNVLPFGQSNIYKSFLSDLDTWKNTDHLIADYAAVPYDWRLSLDDILSSGNNINGRIYYSGDNAATSTPYILQELHRLAANSRTGKVTIIAHSNGGLLTKALIKQLTDAHDPILEKIDKIIFVAVPQTGTPAAIGALLHGYGQGLPKDWLPLILSPATARIFASTSPMAYQLLPSAAYFTGEGGTVRTPMITFTDGTSTQQFIDRYGHAVGNFAELHDFLLGSEGRTPPVSSDLNNPSVLSASLLAYGENVHRDLDDNWILPSSITLYQIAGWGMETVSGVRYSTSIECTRSVRAYCAESRPKLEYTPEMVVDGDGTVVTPSALAMSTSSPNVLRYWVDLKAYGDSGFLHSTINREHADILEVQPLRTLTKSIFTNATVTIPIEFISTSTPIITKSSDKRLLYFLHSPLALSARDSAGNEISAATSTIPGARYQRFGEVQYVSLPASTNPTLVLTGTAQGSFTLEVQEASGGTVTASTTFAGIPTSTSTIATMDFGNGTIANASALRVDQDGNGSTDFSLAPQIGGSVTLPSPDPITEETATTTAPESEDPPRRETTRVNISGGSSGERNFTPTAREDHPATMKRDTTREDDNDRPKEQTKNTAKEKIALLQRSGEKNLSNTKIRAKKETDFSAGKQPAPAKDVFANLASVGGAFGSNDQELRTSWNIKEKLSGYWHRVTAQLKETVIRWRGKTQ